MGNNRQLNKTDSATIQSLRESLTHYKDLNKQQNAEIVGLLKQLSRMEKYKENQDEAVVWSRETDLEELRSQQETLVSTNKKLLAEVKNLERNLQDSEYTRARNDEDWENNWRLWEKKVNSRMARLKDQHCQEKEAEIVGLLKQLSRMEKDKENQDKAVVWSRETDVEELRSQQETLVSTNKELLAEVEKLKRNLKHYEDTRAKNDEEWENHCRLREEKVAEDIARLKDQHCQEKEAEIVGLLKRLSSMEKDKENQDEAVVWSRETDVEELKSQQETLVSTNKELLAEVEKLKRNLKHYEDTRAKNHEEWENHCRLREEKVAEDIARLKDQHCQEKEAEIVGLLKRLSSMEKDKENQDEAVVWSRETDVEELKSQQETLVSTNKELLAEVEKLKRNLKHYEDTRAKNHEEWENHCRLREEKVAEDIARLKDQHCQEKEAEIVGLLKRLSSMEKDKENQDEAVVWSRETDVEELKSQQETLVSTNKKLQAEVKNLERNLQDSEYTRAKNDEDWENSWRLWEKKVYSDMARLKDQHCHEKEALIETIRGHEGKVIECQQKAAEWSEKFEAAEARLEESTTERFRERDQLQAEVEQLERNFRDSADTTAKNKDEFEKRWRLQEEKVDSDMARLKDRHCHEKEALRETIRGHEGKVIECQQKAAEWTEKFEAVEACLEESTTELFRETDQLQAEVEQLERNLRDSADTTAKNKDEFEKRWRLREEKVDSDMARLKDQHCHEKEALIETIRGHEGKVIECQQKAAEWSEKFEAAEARLEESTTERFRERDQLQAEVEQLERNLRDSADTTAKNKDEFEKRWRLREEKVDSDMARLRDRHCQETEALIETIRGHEGKVIECQQKAAEWSEKFEAAEARLEESTTERFRERDQLQAEVEQLERNLRDSADTRAKKKDEWEKRWRLQEEKAVSEMARLKDQHCHEKEALRETIRGHEGKVIECQQKAAEWSEKFEAAEARLEESTTERFRERDQLQAEVEQLERNLRDSADTTAKNKDEFEKRWRLREEKVDSDMARLKDRHCHEKEALIETIRGHEGKVIECQKAAEWSEKFEAAEARLEESTTERFREREELLQRARETEERNRLDIKVLVDRILHLNSLTSKTKLKRAQKEAARRSKEESRGGEKQTPSRFSS